MAEVKNLYGTVQALTVANLSTLANATSATSSTVSNTSTNFLDALLEVTITTAAGAVPSGIVEIRVKGSIDNTDFDDDANDKWIGTVALDGAGAQTRKRVVSVAAGFNGAMPAYWQVRIRNATGAALTAGAVSYLGMTVQSL